MHRRLFCPLLAATVLTTALCGILSPASAAIRVTISDGVNPTKVFYRSSADSFQSMAATFTTNIGDYELLVATTGSNFPGSVSSGSLAQSVFVNDLTVGAGTLPTLTVSTAIIADVAVTTDAFGQVLNPMDIMTVNNASLLQFTLPSDPQLLVTTAVTSVGSTLLGGNVTYTSTVNMVNNSASIPVDTTQGQTSTIVNNMPGGYTLASQLVLSGAGVGTNGLVIGGSTSVRGLIPEPASTLVWGLGALGLVAAAWRRRKATAAP